jgi:GNAT superfamily N-acetyltransferase
MPIDFRAGNDIELDHLIELYRASTLGERRPIEDRRRMAGMLYNANLVISAWDGDLLVGVSRSLTDFHYVTYCADLAVRVSHQRQGIGKELLRRTQAAGPTAALVLLAAPAAVDYYGHIGMIQHPSAWALRPGQELP